MKKHRLIYLLSALIALTLTTVACGGGSKDSKVAVTGVTLDKATLSLPVNGAEILTATVIPNNAQNTDVTWSSDKAEAATVLNGSVTAVAPGIATITVTTVDGGHKAFCVVTVTSVAVTGVVVNPTALNLTVGETRQLTETVLPEDAANKAVTWASIHNNAATVSPAGIVTAVAPGSAIIAVTTADGNHTAVCDVTVNPAPIPVESVGLDKAATSIMAGQTERLTATVLPDDASNKVVSWASSDQNIAIVAADGAVTAVATGNATITATTQDGGFKASCELSVINVYVAGKVNAFPIVWTNGVPQMLLTQEQYYYGIAGGALSVFVTNDGHVYASGWDDDDEENDWFWIPSAPRIWKDGELYQRLNTGDYREEVVWSVAVSETGDVHAAGDATRDFTEWWPKYWINGEPQTLSAESNYASAYSVVVSGNDVYIAGVDMTPGLERYRAVIWKNGGSPQYLNPSDDALARQVFVSNGIVYAVGRYMVEDRVYAAVWKDGEMQIYDAIEGSAREEARSIFVSGDDVYVAGWYTDSATYNCVAVYWKNGVARPLTETNGFALAHSIYVFGDDVFVGGADDPENDYYDALTIWKNGVPNRLADGLYAGGSQVNSIVVTMN